MSTRREALKTIATGTLGAAASSFWVDSLVAQAQAHHVRAAVLEASWKPRVLTAWQDKAVGILAERIIPETDTPGALAAGVNRFIDATLAGASPADRASFLRGLAWIDARSKSLFGADIVEASPAQQTELLTRLAADGNPDAEDQTGREFFQAMKALTINGYYSTEIGLMQELGDDGQLFSLEFKGCDHPDHQ